MCWETSPHRSGRGRRKRTRTTSTSPAAYFTSALVCRRHLGASAAAGSSQRGRDAGTPGRNSVAESRRPAGGGGAGGEGLGRSRGGFTSEIHLSADGFCRPLSLIVTPGQRAGCTQFVPVPERIRVPRLGSGRPRKKPDSVAADKAYSNGPCRQYLRRRGIRHTIPEKGRQSGRPPAQRPTRRTATGLRRGSVQEAQHLQRPSGCFAVRLHPAMNT
ncbi:transposase [Streptomyces sanyensis]|uniref:transposase n=1 Tax=Streptomyces sanyensis TaxID=568869 RepID=UPI003D76BC96